MASSLTQASGDGMEVPAVLLVDDNPRNLVALESVLTGDDFTLETARTGEQALLALMHRDFAAIVLDVKMPDVSGIDLARLIKQRKRTQHIPIIFLTAHYREEAHVMQGYDAGAVDYLTKPLSPTVLRSKVSVFVELFRKTRALASANAQLAEQNTALQREAEERLRRIRAESAQAEAEAANAAKDRFLAMLSHELRTPLSPILYAATLLERDEECSASMREALEIIRRNVMVETRLIDDLLDIARIRSNKLTLQMETVDAHQVLRDTMGICFGEASERSVELVERLDAKHAHVRADPLRLRQVFWNLLTNAAKFTPAGGTVTVRTENPPDDGSFLLEINDTGIGIEPHQLDRIFDAFEQAASDGSRGLGLGLAISKALVDLHGGRITAHSDGSGRGASIAIRLPCSPMIPAEREVPVEDLPLPMALRVLLVEDHEDTAGILRVLLERQGWEVQSASTIARALEFAETYPFEILISDIGLPDGNGTDLVKRLRAGTQRPFWAIAMSGFGMAADLERSRAAGFCEHLTKPVEFTMLKRVIARLVETNGALVETAIPP